MAEVGGSGKRSRGVISWPPLGGGWQREALTGGENERILSLPPSRLRRATSLTEGGKDGGYGNPSVALRATPQLRFAAQPSVSTGPPLHKGGFGIPRLRARGRETRIATGAMRPRNDSVGAGLCPARNIVQNRREG